MGSFVARHTAIIEPHLQGEGGRGREGLHSMTVLFVVLFVVLFIEFGKLNHQQCWHGRFKIPGLTFYGHGYTYLLENLASIEQEMGFLKHI